MRTQHGLRLRTCFESIEKVHERRPVEKKEDRNRLPFDVRQSSRLPAVMKKLSTSKHTSIRLIIITNQADCDVNLWKCEEGDNEICGNKPEGQLNPAG